MLEVIVAYAIQDTILLQVDQIEEIAIHVIVPVLLVQVKIAINVPHVIQGIFYQLVLVRDVVLVV